MTTDTAKLFSNLYSSKAKKKPVIFSISTDPEPRKDEPLIIKRQIASNEDIIRIDEMVSDRLSNQNSDRFKALYQDKGKKLVEEILSETDEDKRKLKYEEYISFLRSFMDISFDKEEKRKLRCLYCNQDKFFSNSGIIYCSNCSSEISPEISLYSINKKNIYSTYVYEEKENFRRAIERFQGKQKVKFPKDMFERLDRYFVSYGLPTGKEVREKKIVMDKEFLLKALSENKLNKYYEDINLICNIYWNYELPDISHIEKKLMEDYEKFNEVYRRIKKDRKSSLNTQFLLYKLLKRNGYPCNKSDFKLIKTADIIELHKKIYKEVCKELNW
jgi:transcription elongation factor Elf1